MKTPASNNEHDPVAAALRRDAARIQEPPFDPALHHATLRRIRAMADSGAVRSSWRWRPALAGVAALGLLALGLSLWMPGALQRATQQHATVPAEPDFDAMLASTRTAVASFSADASSPLPGWISPT